MKRILAILVVLTLVVSVFASCKKNGSDEPTTFPDTYIFRELSESVYAEAATSFAGGSGTESDPYKIADKAQLYYFAKLINEVNIPKSWLEILLSELTSKKFTWASFFVIIPSLFRSNLFKFSSVLSLGTTVSPATLS